LAELVTAMIAMLAQGNDQFKREEGMEADDLLCSRNARSRKTLARADGTSRRASGWAGEKVARRGRSVSPHPWRV